MESYPELLTVRAVITSSVLVDGIPPCFDDPCNEMGELIGGRSVYIKTQDDTCLPQFDNPFI